MGGLKSEKMQTVLCENHFFASRLFGFSELHLALLGSSRPLLGQSWGPDGTQKTPKSDPKIGPKMTPKREPVLGRSCTHFGVLFGAQNGVLQGARFSSCFGKIKTSLERFVFFMLPCVCVFDVFWEFLFSITDVFQKWVPFLVLFWL